MRTMRHKAPDRAHERISARVVATLAVASVAMLIVTASASAALKQDLQRFSDCPYNNPIATQCVYSRTTSGEFLIGKGAVPITKTVTIQGGLTPPVIVPAADGETLSKTALTVPGGLVGIELPGNFSEVSATAEIAGQGSLGNTVALPLKVKLDNPLLGSGCYIGSEAEPLSLSLTYGTTTPPPPNKPISGKATITTKDGGAIKAITGTLVDNAFAAPGASGCTLLPLVGDLAVNNKEGLPAAAGTNTAIMSGVTEEVSAALVKAVLPLPDFGRCRKLEGIEALHGGFTNSSCTSESPERAGKYEWTTGPGAGSKFTGATGAVKLESTGRTIVTCAAGTASGEYAGPKTETATLKLSGCQTGARGKGTACQSAGAASEEVRTAGLTGSVDFIHEGIDPEKPSVGIDFKPTSGTQIAAFECGGAAVVVGGSVIAPIGTVDKMTEALKVIAKASAGIQSVEAFEAGPKDTLSMSVSGGAAKQAGLSTTVTQTGQEPIEIKAIP